MSIGTQQLDLLNSCQIDLQLFVCLFLMANPAVLIRIKWRLEFAGYSFLTKMVEYLLSKQLASLPIPQKYFAKN